MNRFTAASAAVLVCVAASTLAPSAHAQNVRHWKVSADAPITMVNTEVVSDSTLWFVTMAPGWHITMGPGGLLYDPRYIAEGRFDAEVDFFVFPNSTNDEVGLFLGGKDLDVAGKAYTAFVIRRDGSAGVFRREAGRETALYPWAKSAAVVGPESSGRNVLRVAMDSSGVHFLVNGTRIHSWPRAQMTIDGHFGYRVGKRVNVHATRLDVLHRLGPIRPGK